MTVKIDTDARIIGVRLQEQSVSQTGTVAGYGLLYEKTDQQLYLQNASGTASNIYHMGTAFPGSPLTNELFFRTDRGLLYFYDGTRWVTSTLYCQPIASVVNVAASITSDIGAVWEADYDIYVIDLVATMYGASGITSGAYWTLDIRFWDGATQGAAIASVNNQSDANATFVRKKASINALMGTSKDGIEVVITKTGSPGNLYAGAFLTYRLVG